jgi:hypothetical protein
MTRATRRFPGQRIVEERGFEDDAGGIMEKSFPHPAASMRRQDNRLI